MRFVENGNVLLMKEGTWPRVTENYTDWGSLGLPNTSQAAFIVQQLDSNSQPVYKAALTQDGYLYLAGEVLESQTGLAEPESGSTAFVVKDKNDTVQSLIDDAGNLKMRGYLLVDGIPFALHDYTATDAYYPF